VDGTSLQKFLYDSIVQQSESIVVLLDINHCSENVLHQNALISTYKCQLPCTIYYRYNWYGWGKGLCEITKWLSV